MMILMILLLLPLLLLLLLIIVVINNHNESGSGKRKLQAYQNCESESTSCTHWADGTRQADSRSKHPHDYTDPGSINSVASICPGEFHRFDVSVGRGGNTQLFELLLCESGALPAVSCRGRCLKPLWRVASLRSGHPWRQRP